MKLLKTRSEKRVNRAIKVERYGMLQFLVVEPDHNVSSLLQEELQQTFGARVVLAGNGEHATRLFRERTLDLAVIEAMLPDISGFELAERAANCNVPALLMSGHPSGQDTCRTCGYPHLGKPFSLQDLADAARAAVRNSQQNIARLHRAYERLAAAFERSEAISAGIRQTLDEAHRVVELSRQLREENSRIRIASASAHEGLPSARTSTDRSSTPKKSLCLR